MALYGGTVRLKGERVSLCVMRSDDEAINQYIQWLNNENINHWFGLNSRIHTFDEEKEFLSEQDSLDNLRFLIMVNSNGQIIGNCCIHMSIGHYRNYARRAGLGILIGEEDCLGKGYGTEVMRMLVKFCFEELNMHSVGLQVMEGNKRATSCYKKAGFQTCGVEHDSAYIKGEYMNVLHMEILKKDYMKAKEGREEGESE